MDFGSNAIRGVVAQYSPMGLDIIKKYRFPIRLGDDVFHMGLVPSEKIHNMIEVMRFFKEECYKYGVTQIVAVGTSALRDASNQVEVVNSCFEATGIKIQVISGSQEAKWIWMGVKNALHIENHICVLMDIGGGSVEVTLNAYRSRPQFFSLPFGTLRALEDLNHNQFSPLQFKEYMNVTYSAKLKKVVSSFKNNKIEFIVGTGGNLTSLLDLSQAVCKKPRTSSLSREQLSKIVQTLESMNSKARQKTFGLRPDRADVIVPAGHFALLLMEVCQCEEIVIPGVGLREGVLWSLVAPSKKR